MILDIIYDSLKYSFSSPKTVLKLGVFELMSIFIVPIFVVSGYQFKIIDESLDFMIYDDVNIAQLNGFKTLFVNGLKIYFAKLIYLIVPIILLAFLCLGIIDDLIGSIVSILLFAILYCFCYVAIPNMVKYNSFKKAFDLKEIHNIIKSNLGYKLLFGVFIAFALIYHVCNVLLRESLCYVDSFLNIDFMVFSSISLAALISFIVTGLIIQPFMHILVARISGLLYACGSDD